MGRLRTFSEFQDVAFRNLCRTFKDRPFRTSPMQPNLTEVVAFHPLAPCKSPHRRHHDDLAPKLALEKESVGPRNSLCARIDGRGMSMEAG